MTATIIRPAQFEAFERQAHQDYENELVAHLKEFSPRHANGIGDEGLRALIRSGLQKARSYGFQMRGSLRFFVECQMMFGHDFDHDPLMPWARVEWSKKPGFNELARADQIHAIAMTYRKSIVGDKEEIEIAAIERLLEKPTSEWLSGEWDDRTTEKWIQTVYPEKVSANPGGIATVIAHGHAQAKAQGLSDQPGCRVLTALSVAFGHGVLNDPQFPWVAKTLRDTAGQPPVQRVEKLTVRALAYLSDGLAFMKGGT